MSDPSVVVLGATVISGVVILVIRHIWSRSYGVQFTIEGPDRSASIQTHDAKTIEDALDGVEELIDILTEVG